MIVYNVTISVDNDIQEEWLSWMKQTHIPDVMNTGCFIEHRIFKVMSDDDTGTTFAIQYVASGMEKLEEYHQNFSPALQKEHADRYKDKFVAFRTILEVL